MLEYVHLPGVCSLGREERVLKGRCTAIWRLEPIIMGAKLIQNCRHSIIKIVTTNRYLEKYTENSSQLAS